MAPNAMCILDEMHKAAGEISNTNEDFIKIATIESGSTIVRFQINKIKSLDVSSTKDKLINPKFLFFILKTLPIPNLGYSRHFKELKKFKKQT